MFERLSFFIFFILDLYFVVSGLFYLRTGGEVIYSLLFLVFIWYVTWSIHKIKMYLKEKEGTSFVQYYFSYLIKALEVFGNERRLGPTKFFRIASISLSALVGIGTILFLLYYNISTVVMTKDLVFRYSLLFLNVTVYPFVVLFIRMLTSGGTIAGITEKFLNFFPLRFTQLFMYLFTFISPIAWLAIAFLSYIISKSAAVRRKELTTNNI